MRDFWGIHFGEELIIVPFIWSLCTLFIHNYSIKYEKNTKIRRYIRIGFQVKLLLFYGMIGLFWVVYNGLYDTGTYFLHIKEIVEEVSNNQHLSIFDFYFNINNVKKYSDIVIYKFGVYPSNTLPLLALPFYFIAGGSFLGLGTLLTFISFLTTLLIYKCFVLEFPWYKKSACIAAFYLPSTLLWSSGLYKDTFAFIGANILVYSVYRFLYRKNFKVKYMFFGLMAVYLIMITKPHILIIFPILIIFSLGNLLNKFSKDASFLIQLIFVGILIFSFQFIIGYLGTTGLDVAKFTDYNRISGIIDGYNNHYTNYTQYQGGSQYNIGEINTSVSGMLKLAPNAFIVTFFRPFLWEFDNPIYLLNVIESGVLLSLTIFILVLLRRRFLTFILRSNFLKFCIVFSLIFGVMVGITSFNFGTLSRYKIPCMPYFAFTIFSGYAYWKTLKKRKLRS